MSTPKFFYSIVILCSLISSFTSGNVCPTIKTRLNWGAAPSKSINYMVLPVKNVIIAHSVSPRCYNYLDCATYVYNLQRYLMNEQNFPDISYNFLIGDDGFVYEGVGWNKAASHTYGWNSKSIGIGFIGTFSSELPTQPALDAAKKLLECGVVGGHLDERYKLFGHRQLISIESPGLLLYNEIQTWDNWSANP